MKHTLPPELSLEPNGRRGCLLSREERKMSPLASISQFDPSRKFCAAATPSQRYWPNHGTTEIESLDPSTEAPRLDLGRLNDGKASKG
jgi:hypothetical protein